MQQFNRKWSLKIGEAGKTGIEITELNIKFDITKTDESSDQNKASITVYNLNDSDISRLKKGLALILSVAYDDQPLVTLFAGQVSGFDTHREQASRATLIQCSDGYMPLKETFSFSTFPSGTNALQIVQSLIKDLTADGSISKSEITDQDTLTRHIFSNGYYVAGLTRDALQTLLGSLFMKFSIQGGVIYISSALRTNTQKQALLLTPDTGLIDSPRITAFNPNGLERENIPNNGLQITSLVNPRIVPHSIVKVETQYINSFYRVSKINHRGETLGKNWKTLATLEAINNEHA
ncbi:phage protein [Piscirickettsia litoralis]|uniref:Phage tail protein n=1 Tax=Piscirickettsia litoralis TaxID=1891921 RepID=A0ABX2ZWG3_9GAMM|nr:hypothetical protein [Piscirickettsia litoralis]ODN40966.1 hypothetical protein BGC07_18805 [Piscirickettsia litoralis]